MSNGVVDQLDQIPLEEFSSPFSGHFFEMCDPDLFSEVNSNSNCCYDANSSTKNFNSFTRDALENNDKTTTASTANSSANLTQNLIINNINNLSIIFDSPDEVTNNINAPIDLSTFPQSYNTINRDNDQSQFDFSSIPNLPPNIAQFSSVPKDECLSSIPLNLRMNTNSMDPSNAILESAIGPYFSGNVNAIDNSTILNTGLYLNANNEIQIQDIDFQGDNGGMFCPDGLPRVFNPKDLQALNNENQHLVNGCGTANPLASELLIHKLSPEERREKILRYMKKRSERNFSKKIKYACRKTLADSRPRVRGRFAKNDELVSESPRAVCSSHKEHIDVESQPVVVKEENMFDSSDIFAHISGANSFKCNYSSIPSWI